MSYMVAKIFLYGISFNIVYNESDHKNIIILNPFRSSGKKYHLKKTEMEEHETALFCHTHIYRSNRTPQIQIIS